MTAREATMERILPSEALEEALNLIRKGWTQSKTSHAKDDNGNDISMYSHFVTHWTPIGALHRGVWNITKKKRKTYLGGSHPMEAPLIWAIREMKMLPLIEYKPFRGLDVFTETINGWNEDEKRTKDDVIMAFTIAIQKQKQREEAGEGYEEFMKP